MQRITLRLFLVALMLSMAVTSPLSAKEAKNMEAPHHNPANDVRAFVYQWFHWFDVHADEKLFLEHLAEDGLELRYPESTLRSHAEFAAWYRGVGDTIRSNTHDVSEVEVTVLAEQRYQITLRVWWRAVTTKGESLSINLRQIWQIKRHQDHFLVEKLHAEIIEL